MTKLRDREIWKAPFFVSRVSRAWAATGLLSVKPSKVWPPNVMPFVAPNAAADLRFTTPEVSGTVNRTILRIWTHAGSGPSRSSTNELSFLNLSSLLKTVKRPDCGARA